ncbi:MAG: hypothetical protein QW115_04620, partial [Thermoplasmata archaeon]
MMDKKLRKKILSRPVEMIDLERSKTVLELVEAYKNASIQARNIGKCMEVYENMLLDKDRPTVIMGLSGAL